MMVGKTLCEFVGTGDSGGAVFKDYNLRTIQVNSLIQTQN